MPLTCTLSVPAGVPAGQPALLHWRLHNPGPQPVQVLVWGTPFEPVWFAPYVTVTRGGTALRYNGPTMKRGDPQAAQYLRFDAGQTREASVALEPAFEVAAPGRYTVTPQITLHDVAVGAAVPRPRAQHQPQALACNAVEFDVR